MLSGQFLEITQLEKVAQFAINLIKRDASTYTVAVMDTRDQTIVAELPIDPMDNTLAAVISTESVKKLGNEAKSVLDKLSDVLRVQIGAKEFVMLPVANTMPEYVPVEQHSFKRPRHATREAIQSQTSMLLGKYADFVAEMHERFEFVLGVDNLAKLVHKPYHKIFELLAGHANFTEDKMAEYKEEDIQGAKSRLHNSNVTVVSMLDKQNKLCGIIRSLAMGNGVGYLSDETIIQDVLPVERFEGSTAEEKMQNRGKFLLAYFANRALALMDKQTQFVIIAAAGRESLYESMGFHSFPMNSSDYCMTVKLGPPGELLKKIKEELMRAPSHVVVAGQFAVTSSPEESSAADVRLAPLSMKK